MGSILSSTGRNPIKRTGRFEIVVRYTIVISALAFLCVLLSIFTQETEGVAWHDEGTISQREYKDIVLTDLEGDGDPEVGGILKEPGGGDPAVEFQSYSGGWYLRSENITPGSLYSDLDILGNLVATGHSGGNSVDAWFYDPDSHEFTSEDPESVIQNYSLSVRIADLDNDSHPDIVSGYKEKGIKIFYGTASGGWELGNSPKTKDMVKSLFIADVDNDGYLDIVNTNKLDGSTPRGIEIWYGDGNRGWTGQTVYSEGDYSYLYCNDVNDDDFQDIVASGDGEGIDLFIYPDGAAWQRDQVVTKGAYSSILLQDLNADDSPELIGCRFDDGGINIYQGKGDGEFTTEDFGPLDSGNFRGCLALDFDGDGHTDLLGAGENGLHYWTQELPEIRNIAFPEIMYAEYHHYYLSMEAVSESLRQDPNNLDTVKLKVLDNGTTIFILQYDEDIDHFTVEEGLDAVLLDQGNSSSTELGDGRVRIRFSVWFKWAIPDLDPDKNATVEAYMSDISGSTGWVEKTVLSWSVISSVSVMDLAVDDDMVNPGMTVMMGGRIIYNNSVIPIPDGHVKSVSMLGDDLQAGKDELIVDSWFSINYTLPQTANDYIFWPMIVMDRGEIQPVSLTFPEMSITVHSDFVVVSDMWISGERYFDFNSQTHWARGGESLSFHVHAVYNNSDLFYDGELRLTNGTTEFNTTEGVFTMNINTVETVEQILVPVNDSAFNNPYGPMLVTSYSLTLKAIWDGERPLIQDFMTGSLVNGSEIKAVDANVIIIVEEQGGMYPNEAVGGVTIFWSIIQDENTTINGSAKMVEGWFNDNYTYTYSLPLSQAKTDNIVYFWFKGNDTVGNELLSALWPVRCTEEEPATILVDPKPPSAPTGLFATVGNGYVELRWKKNTEDDMGGYVIYRSTDLQFFYRISGSDLVIYTYYKDESVENGKTYYYKIKAVDRALIPNESNFSEMVEATPEEDRSLTDNVLENVLGNLLFVFILVVVVVLAVGIRTILKKDTKKAPEKVVADPGAGAVDTYMAPKVPDPVPDPATSGSVNTPEPGQMPSRTPDAGFPDERMGQQVVPENLVMKSDLPAIQGVCPKCNQLVHMEEGQRFCTNCGHGLR